MAWASTAPGPSEVETSVRTSAWLMGKGSRGARRKRTRSASSTSGACPRLRALRSTIRGKVAPMREKKCGISLRGLQFAGEVLDRFTRVAENFSEERTRAGPRAEALRGEADETGTLERLLVDRQSGAAGVDEHERFLGGPHGSAILGCGDASRARLMVRAICITKRP
jgi:hypothetical protein